MTTKFNPMETCPIGVPVIALCDHRSVVMGTRINDSEFVDDRFPTAKWPLEDYSGWLPICQWIDAKKVPPPKDGNWIMSREPEGNLEIQWNSGNFVGRNGGKVNFVLGIDFWCYAPDECDKPSLTPPPNVDMKIDLEELYQKLETPTYREGNLILRSVVRRCHDAEKALAAISELARKEGNNAPNE